MKIYASARLQAAFTVDVHIGDRAQPRDKAQIMELIKKYDGRLLQNPTRSTVKFSVGSRGDAEGVTHEINERFGATSEAEYH